MTNQLATYLHPPSKQEFAATFRVVSRISFWVQLALGAVSVLALVFALLSRNLTAATDNPGIGFGVFLAAIAILLLCFRVYFAFRYRRLAKRLQEPNSEIHPKKEEVIKALRIGLIASAIGLLLAFVASEVTVGIVLAKVLALPQRLAVYDRENALRALDIFVLLSNINLIGAHFIGGVTPLGLLNWVDQ